MVIIVSMIFLALTIFIKLKMPMWKGKYSERLEQKKMLQLPNEYVILMICCLKAMGAQLR